MALVGWAVRSQYNINMSLHKESCFVSTKPIQDLIIMSHPIWRTIAKLKCLKSSSSTRLLAIPSSHRPRTDRVTSNFTQLLCIILSGDEHMNPVTKSEVTGQNYQITHSYKNTIKPTETFIAHGIVLIARYPVAYVRGKS